MKFPAIAAVALAASLSGAAQAAAIIAPTQVTANTGTAGAPLWVPRHMIDQTGLSEGYIAGVTDFGAYIATDPKHTYNPGTPWLSVGNVTSSLLTFDFGRVVTLGQLALWDDIRTTISSIKLALPGQRSFATFDVTDFRANEPVPAQVFDFRAVETRYLTIEISGCNQPQSGGNRWSGCGVGEIVFAEPPPGGVPEPATWAMMILGFGAAGAAIRRRRVTVPA